MGTHPLNYRRLAFVHGLSERGPQSSRAAERQKGLNVPNSLSQRVSSTQKLVGFGPPWWCSCIGAEAKMRFGYHQRS